MHELHYLLPQNAKFTCLMHFGKFAYNVVFQKNVR